MTDFDPPELDEARDWFRKAADGGNTDAMFMLMAGVDDPPLVAEAREWWQKAAAAGHSNAAFMLDHGPGSPAS